MTFLDECIRESLPVWEDCLKTEFLRGVADGSIPETCFKGYIVDDSLYLREYSKVFAWGIVHSHDMQEIRSYYSLLSFVNESEDATRLYYLKRYQLTDAQIQHLPLRPENQAYVDYMLDAVRQGGGTAACMMACLPCMLSYAWIFRELLRRTPQVLQTPYRRFVEDYITEAYHKTCLGWIAFAEQSCAGLSMQQRQQHKDIFYSCSVHELRFWQMCARPRTDLK